MSVLGVFAIFNTAMSIELGLSRITRLLEHLGNPQNSLRVLHVAGTNGKGSVCSYLSSVLQQTPYQIGRFTTPHLVHVTDSITINNKPISLDKYQDIRLQLEASFEQITFLEMYGI